MVATKRKKPQRREMEIGRDPTRVSFLGLMDYKDPPKNIHFRNKLYVFHKRKQMRRSVLAEVKKLRAKGYHSGVFEVRRGKRVVDHIIYKRKV